MHQEKNERVFSKEDGYANLERINGWINNCDTKSSIFLGLIGIIFTISLTSSFFSDSLKYVVNLILKNKNVIAVILSISSIIIIFFIFLFLIKGMLKLIDSLKGRIDPVVYKSESLNCNSNLFFCTIASKKFKDFHKEITDVEEKDLLCDINSQVYINAKICNEKFKSYNKALKFITYAIKLIIVVSVLLLIINSGIF